MLSLLLESKFLKATALGLLLALALPASALAIDYGGVGARPANPDANNPRTKSIFVYSLKPGVTKLDAVTVYNNSSAAKTVDLYAVDAETSNTGAFACKQQVEPRKEVGSWVVLATSRLTLEPNTSQTVPLSVTVPNDASVGEHDGCVVVQEVGAVKAKDGVVLNFRSALRVSVTVPGQIIKKLAITSYAATKNDAGRYVFTPKLQNLGNVSVDADIKLSTRNLFGMSVYDNGGIFPVLAHKSAEMNFEMNRPFWGGLYRSQASVVYDSDPTAALGTKGNSEAKLASQTVWLWATPKPLALVIELAVVIAILALLFWQYRRRHSMKKIRSTWRPYVVTTGESINSIAARHHVSWQKLAKINRLKAPYTLMAGRRILVPPIKKINTHQTQNTDKVHNKVKG